MSDTCVIKKAITVPDGKLVTISEITSTENIISRPRNTLLITSYRTLPGNNSELNVVNKCVLIGKDYGTKYHDVSIINDPDGYYNYKLVICGLDKNKFDHDPDRLFAYVLDNQLSVVKSMFRYTHEKHHEYKISSHIISDDKNLIRVIREPGSVIEIDFYLD